MQAAMSADYAIAQFRFLKNLLLVHGRWSYRRTSKLVLYSFYKNICLSMCLFWFTTYSQFSAENFYDSYSLSGFNMLFAAYPVIVGAVLDQDVKSRSALKYPQMYATGQTNEAFSMKLLWIWIANGIWNSLVCYFGTIWWFGDAVIDNTGTSYAIWALGNISYTVVAISVNAKIALETNYWTWVNWVVLFGTIASWFIFSLIYSNLCTVNFIECYVLLLVYKAPSFWLCIIVLTTVCVAPEIVYEYVLRNYFPRPHHIVQEIQTEQRKEHRKMRKLKWEPALRQSILTVSSRLPNLLHLGSYTGYAFAQEEGAATALQYSIQSAAKKKERLRKSLDKGRKSKRKKRTGKVTKSESKEGVIIQE
jgi:phospholipid-transporting ATPase